MGSGLPTASNVHEVAQAINPAARVVYVDNDPLVLVHARALLTSSPEGKCAYIQADLREPETILNAPATRETLDFSRADRADPGVRGPFPAAGGQAPPRSSRRWWTRCRRAATWPPRTRPRSTIPEGLSGAGRAYREGGVRGALRTSEEFADLVFGGLELVDPGVVLVSEWRPEEGGLRPAASEVNTYGAVARKP